MGVGVRVGGQSQSLDMDATGSFIRAKQGQVLEQEGTAELGEVKRSEQSDRKQAVGCTWGHCCGHSFL